MQWLLRFAKRSVLLKKRCFTFSKVNRNFSQAQTEQILLVGDYDKPWKWTYVMMGVIPDMAAHTEESFRASFLTEFTDPPSKLLVTPFMGVSQLQHGESRDSPFGVDACWREMGVIYNFTPAKWVPRIPLPRMHMWPAKTVLLFSVPIPLSPSSSINKLRSNACAGQYRLNLTLWYSILILFIYYREFLAPSFSSQLFRRCRVFVHFGVKTTSSCKYVFSHFFLHLP